nr:C4-type zinc ribbon domain-containing protein [Nocardioides sp. zg-DK7169]
MPEIARLAELSAKRADVANLVRDARIDVDDLTLEQSKVEADVEQVKVRRDRDRDRVEQGLITNPRDLERMNHELQSLERRIASLEDQELEVMERLETAQARLDELTGMLTETEAEIAELETAREEKQSDIDAKLVDVEAQRGPSVEGMPSDLLALYDKLRAAKNGIGAAELRQRRCNGCQLGIDAAELASIKATPADTVVRCEECSRILVRTAESGL